MQASRDGIGDLLRDFYAVYGRPEEGPTPGLNVSALMGVISVEKSELDVLRGALTGQALRRQFVACSSILEDLAACRQRFRLMLTGTGFIPVSLNRS